jgi:hypothetical protein
MKTKKMYMIILGYDFPIYATIGNTENQAWSNFEDYMNYQMPIIKSKKEGYKCVPVSLTYNLQGNDYCGD